MSTAETQTPTNVERKARILAESWISRFWAEVNDDRTAEVHVDWNEPEPLSWVTAYDQQDNYLTRALVPTAQVDAVRAAFESQPPELDRPVGTVQIEDAEVSRVTYMISADIPS